MQTRADQIRKRFEQFHAENPVVWELFQRFSRDIIRSGRDRYSAQTLIERIRWHTDIETRGSAVKLNNDYAAYYARMWATQHPDIPLFSFRHQKSKERPAMKPNLEVVPESFMPDTEFWEMLQ